MQSCVVCSVATAVCDYLARPVREVRGERPTVVVPFGRVMEGNVRWSLNGRFGCRLDRSFRGREMLAISVLAGARVSSVLLLALLIGAAWR